MQVLIVTQLKDAQNNDTQDVSKVQGNFNIQLKKKKVASNK